MPCKTPGIHKNLGNFAMLLYPSLSRTQPSHPKSGVRTDSYRIRPDLSQGLGNPRISDTEGAGRG